MPMPYVSDGIRNLVKIAGTGLSYAGEAFPIYFAGEVIGYSYANTPAPVAQFIVNHIPEDFAYALAGLSIIATPFIILAMLGKFRERRITNSNGNSSL